MHAARIDTQSKPAQLLMILKRTPGAWVDAGYLARLVQTTCLSTHISEIRARGQAVEYGWFMSTDLRGKRKRMNMYRIPKENNPCHVHS